MLKTDIKDKAVQELEEHGLPTDIGKIKEAVVEATQNVAQDVKDKSKELKDAINSYAVEQPLKSMGFAMVAGIILGYFLRNK